jgi:hypothetical protein
MDGTRKYHTKSEVSQTQKWQVWFALTGKWKLAKMYRIPMIQPTDYKKFNKKEGQSENASISL